MHPIFPIDQQRNIKLKPIGYVKSPIKEPQTGGLTEIETEIALGDDFARMLGWYRGILPHQSHLPAQPDHKRPGILLSPGQGRYSPLRSTCYALTAQTKPARLTTVRLISRKRVSLNVIGIGRAGRNPGHRSV